MAELWQREPGSQGNAPVNSENPLSVKIVQSVQPAVSGRTVVRLVRVPGIGAGVAYAAADAFGTLITFEDVFRPEKRSGTVVGAFLLDVDAEGITIDVPIFVRPITATADNAAFAVSDADLLACRAVFKIDEFFAWASNQFGQSKNASKWVVGEDTNLYTQLVITGAATIAAGASPWIGLVVVPD